MCLGIHPELIGGRAQHLKEAGCFRKHDLAPRLNRLEYDRVVSPLQKYDGVVSLQTRAPGWLTDLTRTMEPSPVKTLEPFPILSGTIYRLIILRKSIPPHNRQLKILIGNNEQQVDDFVG